MADCTPALLANIQGLVSKGPRTTLVMADPIFWSEDTSYEYMTIVATADYGQTFISKKDVPSGTPLNNTEYWLPGPTFNAQVANLQNQINEIITTVNSQIEKIENMTALVNVKDYGFNTDTVISATSFNDFLNNRNTGDTIFFPYGTYTFDGPIYFPSSKRINILGEINTFTEQDYNYSTSLIFNNLKTNDRAITLSQSRVSIRNIEIYCNSYSAIVNKDNYSADKECININETVSGVIGIYVPDDSYGAVIDNVTVCKCSGYGIRASIYSVVQNCGIFNCKVGIIAYNDTVINNCRIANVETGINLSQSSLCQINNIRIDSVKNNAIYLANSNGVIITNVNGDFVENNFIVINNCHHCFINGVVSRCGTIDPTTASTFNNDTKTNTNVLAAIIRVQNATNYCYFDIDYYAANPIDVESDFLAPKNAIFFDTQNSKGCVFNITNISSQNTDFSENVQDDTFNELFRTNSTFPNFSGSIKGFPIIVVGNAMKKVTYA